jgi:hypothetical protein
VSKYVSKTVTGPQVLGRQRYGVAEGFQPIVQRIEGTSAAHVLDEAGHRRRTLPTVLIRR